MDSISKYLSRFILTFGPGYCYRPVPGALLDKYKDLLPGDLLEAWLNEGWCSYGNGLLWTVNPEEYQWLADSWLKCMPTLPQSSYYIFARSAFGEFYCLSLCSKKILTISCPRAMIVVSKDIFKVENGSERAIQKFFMLSQKEDYDFLDNAEKPLFARSLAQLGPLEWDEIYGFFPALPLGGYATFEHLKKVKLDAHVEIIKQATNVTVQLL